MRRMILELLEYLITPCSAEERSLGFLFSAMQVRARYRRCKEAWSPHLERTRRAVLEAVSLCRGRRKVVVLGAGLLYDIPIEELSQAFRKVLLVDMVHPWLSRMAVRRFRNVERISADVTEVMKQVRRIAQIPDAPPPLSHPMRFIDDPELDLTLSVNLLSQLPGIPGIHLEGLRGEAADDAFSRQIIEAHLDYLCRLPGHTALITDASVRLRTRDGGLIEEWDALHGVAMPPAEDAWEWKLAPSPEIEPDIDVFTSVLAYPDWKKAAGQSGHET